MPTRTILYVRVSTAQQSESGLSLEAQRAKLAAYAVAMDLDVVAVIEDAGVSAKSLDRPGLQRALGMLRVGQADALAVTKLDRLTRNVRDLGTLLEDYFADRVLLSVGDSIDTRSAAGRLMLNVLTSVAQWERETASERTREVKRLQKSRGKYLGGVCAFGYRSAGEGRVVPDAGEYAAVERIRELRAEGMTVRAIATRIAAEGHRSRTGTLLGKSHVARILSRNPQPVATVALAA